MEERAAKRKRSVSPSTGEGLRTALAKLAETRAGGAYVPPARLKALMAEVARADPGSVEYQRMSWEALRKSITGLVNKVAADNIKFIVPELFAGANLIRGRGLFCRSIMHAQEFSLPFTPVFAALAAIINTKLPFVGELLVVRLVSQFRRSFRRNDKPKCHATLQFLAHLVNQRVAHELLALEILVLLLEHPTDDSVELAVAFMREVGQFLSEEAPKASNSVFDRFRAVLYEGEISVRVQYMVEVLAQTRKDRFKDNPRISEQLDLVEEDDQITHQIGLDDELRLEEGLNIFKPDPEFLENEEKYRQIKAEILGEGDEASDEEEEEEEEEEDADMDEDAAAAAEYEIEDRTETNLVNLRRTIYLVIMSSLDFEECVHKLLKLNVREDLKGELCNMVIECCSQERTYSKFYGHIGERLCKLNRLWSGLFEECFRTYYDTIHRYETNRLRNIARFFGCLLASDSISWSCFEIVHMTEDDTTSSSRIFIKILFNELQSLLSVKTLVTRFAEPSMQDVFANMFPKDHPRDTRFSINYFTSIGLGALTEDMREYLKNAPRMIMEQREAELAARRADDSDASSLSDSASYSSYSSYSSRSYSRSPGGRSYSRSPRGRSYSRSYSRSPRGRSYSRSYSRSPSPRGRSYSRSPSPRGRSYSRSYSRSPSPRGRSYSRSPSPRRSYSRSPSPRRSYRWSPRGRSYSRSYSRSPSPRRPYRRTYSRSPTPRRYSRSPSPRRDSSRWSPRARSYSRSPSPVRRPGRPVSRSPPGPPPRPPGPPPRRPIP